MSKGKRQGNQIKLKNLCIFMVEFLNDASAIKRNEALTDAGNNMDKLWKHDTKWKKPDAKGYIRYDSTYMK